MGWEIYLLHPAACGFSRFFNENDYIFNEIPQWKVAHEK